MYLPTAWGMATARGNAIASEPPAMRRAAIAQRRERIALPNVEVIRAYGVGSVDWLDMLSQGYQHRQIPKWPREQLARGPGEPPATLHVTA